MGTAASAAAQGSAKRTATTTSASGPVRIAVFMGTVANAYYQADLKGAQAAASKFGGKIVQVYDGGFSATKQYPQIQDAITSGKFDAFVIMPVSGSGIVPLLKTAVAKNIKLVCLLVPCGPSWTTLKPQVPGTYYVGTTYPDNGRYLGQLTISACQGKNPCNVVYMPGILTYGPEPTRLQFFKQTIASHPNIKIVATQQGQYLADPSRTAVQNILQSHPNVNVIVTAGDQMTLGAEQALKAAGVKNVALIGNGASTAGVAAVRAGRWYGTVTLLPYTEGYQGTEMVIAAVKGQNTPTYYNTATAAPPVITKTTAGSFKAQW
jgi:ribose transport system substrate-binding protein